MVYCAEPSPDIGRIVSAAGQTNLTGSAKGAKVQPELALAFAASRAEGLAQLGQRLATIQLLRDSTYRACEAYANRAISAATYAMIVSRYDDVMITLLLGEMAAGTTRPSPASLLLAGSAGTSGLSPGTADAVVRDANQRFAAADQQLIAALEAKAKLKPDAAEADRVAATAKVTAAAQERADASAMLKAALSAAGGSSTSVAANAAPQGASGEPGASVTIAQQLASMQQAYLSDFNLDAVTVGCLSALSQLDWNPHAPNGASSMPPMPVAAPAAGSFASTSSAGAYSLQDECRAILANGRTMQDAVQAKLMQEARPSGAPTKP